MRMDDMVSNLDVDIEQQQRIGHLLNPLPPELRDDTSFMDRIHAYLPGWYFPKLPNDHFTNRLGLVSDFLSSVGTNCAAAAGWWHSKCGSISAAPSAAVP